VTERLHVLVVQPFAERNGGSELWLLHLLDATDALDVEVLLLKDGPLRQELLVRGIPVELREVGHQPWHLVAPAIALRRRLRRSQPDVVLSNTVKAQLLAAPVARNTRTPTVWAKHDHSYDRSLARALGRWSTRVVAGAEEVAEATRRPDAVIIPPPRPTTPPAPRETAIKHLRSIGVPVGRPAEPTLVIAGRIVPFKGVEDAVRALALPAAAAWRLVVAGTDDHSSPGEVDRLRAIARQSGVAGRVHFAGHIDDLPRWMAAFDALAVLTRRGGRREPAREGFGGTAFEAMLAGVPVIAVEGGAVVRRLHGRAGLAVPPANPRAVAAALAALHEPAVRDAAGAAGRAITANHPDAEQCAALLVEVLTNAARARPTRGAAR